jgi:hypothetical protein
MYSSPVTANTEIFLVWTRHFTVLFRKNSFQFLGLSRKIEALALSIQHKENATTQTLIKG